MMPITASSPIQGAQSAAASGRIGMAMRTKPYVPSFSRTAARITEPTVGAWVWASGSQVWNGKMGTLMPKPMNMPVKIHSPAVELTAVAATGRARHVEGVLASHRLGQGAVGQEEQRQEAR